MLIDSATLALVLFTISAASDQQTTAELCTVEGRASSQAIPLPGVAIVVSAGRTVAATSTGIDGRYRVRLRPGAYELTASLTAFSPVVEPITLDTRNCAPILNFDLLLAPRAARSPARDALRGESRGLPPRRNDASFERIAPQELIDLSRLEAGPESELVESAARQLLPPGFSTDISSPTVSFTGNVADLDRGLMGDRIEALARGEFDPATGALPPGFGAPGGPQGMPGGLGRPGPPGAGPPIGEFPGAFGPGGPGGPGRPGGPGPGGGFGPGGRLGRQDAFSGMAHYQLGGSLLDASPFQLRADSPADVSPYTRHTFGATFGGPVKIPGVYDGTRRTNFTLIYNGNHGNELFDQYATVPSEAMRSGNFSSVTTQMFDPRTGNVLRGNVIPQELISPTAAALLSYVPLPNLDGDEQNFHYLTTTGNHRDTINARITHNFNPVATRRPGAGRGPRGGPFGPPGLQTGTSAMLNVQLQYRRGTTERTNVFPTLGGKTDTSSFTVPVSLNLSHRGNLHTFGVNLSRTHTASTNRYGFVTDVAGNAGITGVSSDAFAWGVPGLSFSSFTSLRDFAPSARTDRRIATSYTLTRRFGRHTVRAGGDYRWDVSANRTDSNGAGAFVFTGLYAGRGSSTSAAGLDFADFLLGYAQQASVEFGPGTVDLTGRSMSLFLQDDWRKSGSLTFNLGVRYELLWPFVEASGNMVNLDVVPGFAAVAPVLAGGTGPYTGTFSHALIDTDVNNIAPRVGMAWRIKQGTVFRTGYGVSFNSGSYSTIARQLTAQPPFAVTTSAIGTASTPLALSDPFAAVSPTDTKNTFGVSRDYELGTVQTWNADLRHDVARVWNVGASYTHARGSSLDMLRAPNRSADGLLIDGVQSFRWQSSEGSSRLHALTLNLRRRPVRGLGGGVTYTIARSRDNASTLGGGTSVVAQDDKNLDAEWGLSSFDRRHQLAMDLTVELPFGQNRRWLSDGGPWALVFENWRLSANFTWQTGTPNTARVLSSSTDVARGTNGTLRADYNGAEVELGDPASHRYFNTDAFSLPTGAYGTSARNIIIGPGSHLLNMQLSRDLPFSRTRGVTVQVNAQNLLNTMNYAAIDTVVNSPTFGQVTALGASRSVTAILRFRF